MCSWKLYLYIHHGTCFYNIWWHGHDTFSFLPGRSLNVAAYKGLYIAALVDLKSKPYSAGLSGLDCLKETWVLIGYSVSSNDMESSDISIVVHCSLKASNKWRKVPSLVKKLGKNLQEIIIFCNKLFLKNLHNPVRTCRILRLLCTNSYDFVRKKLQEFMGTCKN